MAKTNKLLFKVSVFTAVRHGKTGGVCRAEQMPKFRKRKETPRLCRGSLKFF